MLKYVMRQPGSQCGNSNLNLNLQTEIKKGRRLIIKIEYSKQFLWSFAYKIPQVTWYLLIYLVATYDFVKRLPKDQSVKNAFNMMSGYNSYYFDVEKC